MEKTGKLLLKGVLAGVVGVLFVFVIVALIVVYSGAYNVAATEEHTSVVRWAFTTTLHNSVEARAANFEAPSPATESMIATGAREYKSMCEHCHGGPAIERAGWATGMRPTPPKLVDAASHWEVNEVFWIVKHGIKMAGMPAFGPDHDGQTLWSIAAFVKQLPGMTEEQYAAFEAEGSGEHSHSH
ncbi:c-type cytochrome [Gilvimarinus sp. F26214L]|uniref:c-type cytochrome n=1 Tax=Gilvimarinus sp. DZF01 TaxID=3461371 RepID=UPI0040452A01